MPINEEKQPLFDVTEDKSNKEVEKLPEENGSQKYKSIIKK
jgi:molybdopterin biosynthesis enzyme MoaB